MAEQRILSVTQLNMYVKSLLESSVYLNDIYLSGEISNFTDHYKTGHLYMSLKDEGGIIKGVMFRQYAGRLSFKPQNGMKVICRGKASLYERDGSYQFYITAMKPAGVGELSLMYEQLKARLESEGLFDPALKRPIPQRPTRIAVITSPTGAALQDILNILSRRYPVATVILCPVQVQGELAAPQMTDAIRRVNSARCADVIIIGRGGGSIEDLWAFNDEQLARTVRGSQIPVISAVGHETDFTICDYAADLRAPTPSASAELAVPDKAQLLNTLAHSSAKLGSLLAARYENSRLRFQAVMNRQCMSNPLFCIQQRSQSVDRVCDRLTHGFSELLAARRQQFAECASKLNSLSPLNVLLRGYSAVYKSGRVISVTKDVQRGDEIEIKMSDGSISAVVK